MAHYISTIDFKVQFRPSKINLQFIVTARMEFKESSNNFIFHYLSRVVYYLSLTEQHFVQWSS